MNTGSQKSTAWLWSLMVLSTLALGFLIASMLLDEGNDDTGPGSRDSGVGSAGEGRRVNARIRGGGDLTSRTDEDLVEANRPETLRSSSYKGIQAQVLDARTKKPVTRFTLYLTPENEVAEILASSPSATLEQALTLKDRARSCKQGDGVLRIYGLEDGDYALAIRATGYPLFVARALKVPQEKDLHLFELPRGPFIEGTVVDASGRPVAGMRVYLIVEELFNIDDPHPASRIRTTGRDGRYLFGGLPQGRYSVALRTLQNPADQARDLIVGPGIGLDQPLRLPPLTTVEFTIRNPLGRPIPDAAVRLYPAEGNTARVSHPRQQTTFQGVARFAYLSPGDYTLRITKSGYKLHEEAFKILPGSDIMRVSRSLLSQYDR